MAGAPIATIGAGTGLGECFLTPGEGGHYVAYPSEGGHAEFPPRTETEVGACMRGFGDGWSVFVWVGVYVSLLSFPFC